MDKTTKPKCDVFDQVDNDSVSCLTCYHNQDSSGDANKADCWIYPSTHPIRPINFCGAYKWNLNGLRL